jgi:hypothetical protein
MTWTYPSACFFDCCDAVSITHTCTEGEHQRTDEPFG